MTTSSSIFVCLSLFVAITLAQPQSQIDALNDFYNSTNGPKWTDNANWGKGFPCAQAWFGVKCDENNENVIELKLPGNELVGTIPDSIGQITTLKKLVLNVNLLNGMLPQSLANLKLTDLVLYENLFTGPFPEFLFNITSLHDLDLSMNDFSGQIPDKFDSFPSLESIDLSSNKFSGSVPATMLNYLSNSFIGLDDNRLTSIPWDQWINLDALSNSFITVSANLITGTIPSTVYGIKDVALDFNQFTGTLPELDVSNGVPPLQSFSAGGNKLTGNLPVSLTKASFLNSIFVAYDTNITGVIPVEYASMPKLNILMFQGTGLTCPKDNQQWDDFQKRAVTDCDRNASSYNPHEYLGLYITLFVGGIIFLIAVVALIVFFIMRSRRSKFITI